MNHSYRNFKLEYSWVENSHCMQKMFCNTQSHKIVKQRETCQKHSEGNETQENCFAEAQWRATSRGVGCGLGVRTLCDVAQASGFAGNYSQRRVTFYRMKIAIITQTWSPCKKQTAYTLKMTTTEKQRNKDEDTPWRHENRFILVQEYTALGTCIHCDTKDIGFTQTIWLDLG